MAKSAGHIRASKWENSIYHEGVVRKEYGELSEGRQAAVRAELKRVQSEMWNNLRNKSVTLSVEGEDINVIFTKDGTDHIARDAMMTLSGKYMSRKSMVNIDAILQHSRYVERQIPQKPRKDKKEFFFAHTDTQGRQIFFKVAFDRTQSKQGRYYLYSVTDKLVKE